MRVPNRSLILKVCVISSALFSTSAFAQGYFDPNPSGYLSALTGRTLPKNKKSLTDNFNCADCVPVYRFESGPVTPKAFSELADIRSALSGDFGRDDGDAYFDRFNGFMMEAQGEKLPLLRGNPNLPASKQPIFPKEAPHLLSKNLTFPTPPTGRGDEAAYPLKNKWEDVSRLPDGSLRYNPDQILDLKKKLPPMPITISPRVTQAVQDYVNAGLRELEREPTAENPRRKIWLATPEGQRWLKEFKRKTMSESAADDKAIEIDSIDLL